MFKAHAQCDPGQSGINLADCYTVGIGESDRVSDLFSTPADLLNIIVPNLFIFAGLLIFGLIVYSGFLYINDTTKGKDDAREILTIAAKGFVVMFIAYWVVEIITVVTGIDSIF